jgi:BNR repeat-like domain
VIVARCCLTWLCCLAAVALPAVAAGNEPVLVVGPDSNPRQPQAAVTEDGTVYVVYGAGDSIYVCRSDDLASGVSAPTRVGEIEQLMLGMRRGPRIAAHGDALTVTAIGREGNLLAWHSRDGARTWAGPVAVNNEPTSAREGLHDLAIGAHGQLVCVWLDLRNGGTELWSARSDEGGRTWAANVRIYHSPDGHICECCHPSVALDREGRIYALWRNALDGGRDMYLSTSSDGGHTFGTARQLGTGTWKLDRCPMDGGHLAVTNPRQVTTVWRRHTDIFRTVSAEPHEQRLGHGEQPWAAATREGAWLVWISARPGDLWLLGPGEQSPTRLARDASDPVLAAPLKGTGPVVAVWESGDGRSTEIRAAVVSKRSR